MRPNRIFSQGSATLCSNFQKGSAQFLWVRSCMNAEMFTDKVYKQWKPSVIALCLQKITGIEWLAHNAITDTVDNGMLGLATNN